MTGMSFLLISRVQLKQSKLGNTETLIALGPWPLLQLNPP